MFVFTHKIAGITFRTESDVEIIPIQNNSFEQFLTDDSKFDVYHRISGINGDTLTLPSLSKKEKEHISQCLSPPYCGPGTLILPPLIKSADITCDGPLIHNSLDFPLLQSPSVRSQLESCLNHPEQVFLALHLFSVVIHDYARRTINIFYPTERRKIFNGSWLENGIRRMFTSFLPAFSAVMVHSAGCIRDGKAALFVAPDEGGKSTVLDCLIDGFVLCDDRNIIRKENNAIIAYSTPWGMLTNGPQQARLGGIFLLEKAPRFELNFIKPRELIQFLWNEHIHFWQLLPKNMRIQAFKILYDSCNMVPVYKMRFPKDYVDWDAIDTAMVR